jgi:CrcB protein
LPPTLHALANKTGYLKSIRKQFLKGVAFFMGLINHRLQHFFIPTQYQRMKLILAIGFGSFLGGISRYLLTQYIQSKVLSGFPYGTLVINVAGCFLIGLVFAFSLKGSLSHEWRLFLATGILGGFTTYSAFSYETVALIRDGQLTTAFGYVALSLALGLLATFTGMQITRFI